MNNNNYPFVTAGQEIHHSAKRENAITNWLNGDKVIEPQSNKRFSKTIQGIDTPYTYGVVYAYMEDYSEPALYSAVAIKTIAGSADIEDYGEAGEKPLFTAVLPSGANEEKVVGIVTSNTDADGIFSVMVAGVCPASILNYSEGMTAVSPKSDGTWECTATGKIKILSVTGGGSVAVLMFGASEEATPSSVELMKLITVPSTGYGTATACRVSIAPDGTVTPIAGSTVSVVIAEV